MDTITNEMEPLKINAGEWDYICVEVIRHESTDVYLKVPKGWRPSGRDYKLLGRAAKETTRDHDWDKYGWENAVEVNGFKVVEEQEARQYEVFNALHHLSTK